MIMHTTVTEGVALAMPVSSELIDALRATMPGTVLVDEPMSRHTTFGVGGPADLYLAPEDDAALARALSLLYQAQVPVRLLGNGSNVLVSDRGVRGAVIRLTPRFAEIHREGSSLIVGAGAKLAKVITFAAAEALSGLESTMGIPGTMGGALVMNAGTDIGSLGDLVESVSFYTLAGEPLERAGDQLGYSYRHSALQGGDLVVRSARLRLTPGERSAILAKMERLKEKRTSRQPTHCRTAGSTFKNLPDIAAGKLIDRAGCKGFRLGLAEVSTKHANFIIAHPGATASDIRNLALWMRQRVLEEHGLELEMEVELMGDWDGWTPELP